MEKNKSVRQSQKRERLEYLKIAMFHPFDGFYEIKYRHKGSLSLAMILMIAYGVLQCIDYQYTGFIMNMNPIFSMNSVSIFISSLFLFLLFIVSNWTVTTLFSGKGNMRDIFIVVAYSLVPLMLTKAVVIFASRYIIIEEVIILRSIEGMGILWFVFVLLAGFCVIHEYSFGVNLKTIVVTALAALIIIFLGILFFTLLERMFEFVLSVIQETVRRFY